MWLPFLHQAEFRLHALLPILLSTFVAGCSASETSPQGQGVGEDGDESGSLADDPGPMGKADGVGANTSKERRITIVGRIAYDTPEALPAEVMTPAWSFMGAAGAVIEIQAAGADGIQLYGPRRPGDSWPAAFATETTDALRVTLPGDGLYGLQLQAGAATHVTVSCPAGACAPPAWIHPVPEGQLELVAVGDLGLTASDVPVDREGGWKYGEYHYYFEMLDGFAPFLGAGVNLANLETAVTTGGIKQDKTYVFRMPPEGLSAVLDAGFNLLGSANNHTGDYGAAGVSDTVENLTAAMSPGRLYGFAGAGTGFEAAAAPAVFTAEGVRVAFSACGIGLDVNGSGSGIAHVSDANEVIARLAATDADLRILSIHAGVERDLSPAAEVKSAARAAIDAGVTVVHAHHPHVVQGVEQRGAGVIFYSLGNFELRGARDMGTLDAERDYGLGARIGYDPTARRVSQVEVVVLRDMHRAVYPETPARGASRIEKLNGRSASLGAGGVRFTVDPQTGRGFALLP